MLQRLPIALVQLKVGKTTENLRSEICQVIYILCIEQKKLLKMCLT